ncbi:MAG: hypothetical protein QXD20_09830 [Ignisphaera sp.]
MSWLGTIANVIERNKRFGELEYLMQRGLYYKDKHAEVYFYFLPENEFWQWVDNPLAKKVISPYGYAGVRSDYLVIYWLEGNALWRWKTRLRKMIETINEKYGVDVKYILFYKLADEEVGLYKVEGDDFRLLIRRSKHG